MDKNGLWIFKWVGLIEEWEKMVYRKNETKIAIVYELAWIAHGYGIKFGS